MKIKGLFSDVESEPETLWEQTGPIEVIRYPTLNGSEMVRAREHQVRDATLEEAAKVADVYGACAVEPMDAESDHHQRAAQRIARLIREQKANP